MFLISDVDGVTESVHVCHVCRMRNCVPISSSYCAGFNRLRYNADIVVIKIHINSCGEYNGIFNNIFSFSRCWAGAFGVSFLSTVSFFYVRLPGFVFHHRKSINHFFSFLLFRWSFFWFFFLSYSIFRVILFKWNSMHIHVQRGHTKAHKRSPAHTTYMVRGAGPNCWWTRGSSG